MSYRYEVISTENKKLVSIRIPSELATHIDTYAVKHQLKKTDAYIHFLRLGVEASQDGSDENRLKRIEAKLDALATSLEH